MALWGNRNALWVRSEPWWDLRILRARLRLPLALGRLRTTPTARGELR
jgi:hypothetical protein